MHPPDHSNQSIKRGPITETFNGRGVRPWLPQLTAEPGWVYRVSSPMGNEERRVCWRCMLNLSETYEGRSRTTWEEEPPAAEDRCTRCERSYGERPPASFNSETP